MWNCSFDIRKDPLDSVNATTHITLARGWTAAATVVVALVMFAFACCNMGRKYWRYKKDCGCFFRFLFDYVSSPFFLFAFISMLPVCVYWLILIRVPVYHSYTKAQYENTSHSHKLDPKFCKWPGYTLVWFESAETLALVAFSLYLLLYYIPFHSKQGATFVHREYVAFQTKKRKVKRNEEDEYVTEYTAKVPKCTLPSFCHSFLSIAISLAIVIVCGVYTCPYFVQLAGPNERDRFNATNNETNDTNVDFHHPFRYGDVGPWCWIMPEPAQKDFWFYEEWVFMGVSSVALLAAFVFLCCVVRSPHSKYRPCPSIWWDKTVLVPFLIFLFYFVLQFALLIIEIFVRICKYSDPELWYTYAIGKPLSKIFLVAAALQLMSTSYRMGKKSRGLLEHNNPDIQERAILE